MTYFYGNASGADYEFFKMPFTIIIMRAALFTSGELRLAIKFQLLSPFFFTFVARGLSHQCPLVMFVHVPSSATE